MKTFHEVVLGYRVVIEHDPEDGSFNVHVPVLPGCLTWGWTLEKAKKYAHEVVELYLDAMRDLGDPIPKPDA